MKNFLVQCKTNSWEVKKKSLTIVQLMQMMSMMIWPYEEEMKKNSTLTVKTCKCLTFLNLSAVYWTWKLDPWVTHGRHGGLMISAQDPTSKGSRPDDQYIGFHIKRFKAWWSVYRIPHQKVQGIMISAQDSTSKGSRLNDQCTGFQIKRFQE